MCFYWNIKKSRRTAKLSEKSWNKHDSNGVFYHVRTYNILFSFDNLLFFKFSVIKWKDEEHKISHCWSRLKIKNKYRREMQNLFFFKSIIPNTHLQYCWLSWLGTCATITCCRVRLVIWAETFLLRDVMRSWKRGNKWIWETIQHYIGWFMVFNATFNNILVISWRSVLWVEKTTDLRKSLTNLIT